MYTGLSHELDLGLLILLIGRSLIGRTCLSTVRPLLRVEEWSKYSVRRRGLPMKTSRIVSNGGNVQNPLLFFGHGCEHTQRPTSVDPGEDEVPLQEDPSAGADVGGMSFEILLANANWNLSLRWVVY